MEIVAVEQISLQVLQFLLLIIILLALHIHLSTLCGVLGLPAQYITTNAGDISSVTQHEARQSKSKDIPLLPCRRQG
jgi:hypothetical protein